jgi:hypothetical protein
VSIQPKFIRLDDGRRHEAARVITGRLKHEEPTDHHAAQNNGHATAMKHYLLSIYQPDDGAVAPEALQAVMRDVNAVVEETRAAGVWVFNGGLSPPGSATVVRVERGDALVTDGPYAETKEHIGGFLIVKAPDLDAALEWAARLARALTLPGSERGLAIEVRPFAGEVR